MKTIKETLVWLGLIFAVCSPWAASGAEWLTDTKTALDKARSEDKTVMLDFTGSDWCGWCMKLKSEVFDQAEFGAFAKDNLVLVEVDFPRHKNQSAEEKQANERLAQHYGVNGYPTIVVLNSMGQEIGRTGYHEGGPKAFIEDLKRMPGMHVNNRASNSRRASDDAPTSKHAPEFVPVGPGVQTHYGELALKAISGSANRRAALINNETFFVGDTAKVRVNDTKVEVTCREIREDSVLVIVDGKSVELKLGHH